MLLINTYIDRRLYNEEECEYKIFRGVRRGLSSSLQHRTLIKPSAQYSELVEPQI